MSKAVERRASAIEQRLLTDAVSQVCDNVAVRLRLELEKLRELRLARLAQLAAGRAARLRAKSNE
ncbi:MAG: hypothetical protein WA708_00040 [Acidobacteriaceae bacterium]